MKWEQTAVAGLWRLELESRGDDRGFFARGWCAREAAAHGLNPAWVQMNASLSRHAGTLRGLHWQAAPWEEVKLVRCVRGAIWDVGVDLRPGSPTYLRWHGEELSAENRRALYVPEGCAHGFLSLTPDAEVHYLVSQFYAPEAERGARWDDPALAIAWPRAVEVISDKDSRWPFLGEVRPGSSSTRPSRRGRRKAVH
jgi:dTDP-4-dehydrorhamnose 3,5-epimerase